MFKSSPSPLFKPESKTTSTTPVHSGSGISGIAALIDTLAKPFLDTSTDAKNNLIALIKRHQESIKNIIVNNNNISQNIRPYFNSIKEECISFQKLNLGDAKCKSLCEHSPYVKGYTMMDLSIYLQEIEHTMFRCFNSTEKAHPQIFLNNFDQLISVINTLTAQAQENKKIALTETYLPRLSQLLLNTSTSSSSTSLSSVTPESKAPSA
jgi:hypothetical protein